MISESLGAVWGVQSMRPSDISSLMISESLGAFWVSNPCIARAISSLMISESLGAVWGVESLRRQCYQFVDDF
jgi:hypothetical protein